MKPEINNEHKNDIIFWCDGGIWPQFFKRVLSLYTSEILIYLQGSWLGVRDLLQSEVGGQNPWGERGGKTGQDSVIIEATQPVPRGLV